MEANSDKVSNVEEPAPPGSSPSTSANTTTTQQPDTPRPLPSSKGVENAKKRLRAFSIQKKTTPLSPIVPKPVSTGNTTVLIGKLSSVKTTPKVEDDTKKPPKPPKPGSVKKNIQDSYPDQQRRTLKEIEDMKRKMELVELGIPLGLICPTSTSEKAMPTKAMPPIKTFLGRRYPVCKAQKEPRSKRKKVERKSNTHNEAKVDEIIREAKKIRGEGKQFKFDYNKLLPDYDNPFQRKKDDQEKEYKSDRHRSDSDSRRDNKSDKYDYRRHPSYRKDDRDRYKERDREKSHDRHKNKDDSKEYTRKDSKTVEDKEADVNLKDFLVCDSWSLENDDKTNSCSPKIENKATERKSPEKTEVENKVTENKVVENNNIKMTKDPSQQLQESMSKRKDIISEVILRSPDEKPRKFDKLQPVMDAFKYEIDEPNEDEVLDIFDEDSGLEKYSHVKTKSSSSYESPQRSLIYEHETAIDASMDGMTEDTFLESVINEIRQDDNLCDETSQDKRLVEYDESPNKDDFDSPAQKNLKTSSRGSVTPEMDERMKEQTKQKRDIRGKKESSKRSNDYSERKGRVSRRNEYSDGRRSTESGYKTSDTTESNPKYVENFRLSIERELDVALERSSMAKSTMESLETWSFVLKICQPLLFRHDKNKCYRETRTAPKLWFTENPKRCSCVKDRAVVYQELEMLKMGLVDRVYGCDQIADAPSVNARAWYPRSSACLAEGKVQPVASEWEADDSQQGGGARALTPQRSENILLDREYQRFMEAVWPEVAEAKAAETSRSTTPIQQESKQKKKEEKIATETEERKAKKIKLSSEGWSQESDIEEEVKSKKVKMNKSKGKSRKRKRSMSSLSTISDSDSSAKKKRKSLKKKALKKAKSKEAKRRRIGKKLLKKLKEKQKQKRKAEKEASEDIELQEEKKKELKKRKKKKQQKLKKNQKRKKKESSSSSDSSSTSSSSSDSDSDIRSKKRKRSSDRSKRQKRKKFSSDSQSEELFDVNILNNIKTERLTDDEKGQKLLEFSPRVHHKPREIINVKELQNDFVGNNNILIKKEIEELPKENVEQKKEVKEPQKEVSEEQKEAVKPQKEVIEVENEVENDIEDKSVEDSEENSVNLDTMIVSPPLPVDPPTPLQSEKAEFKEPQDIMMTSGASITVIDESNLSQCSSQESVCSVKETSSYEKDESHLRPSSQNSNYSFNDVIASQSGHYQKGIESIVDNQDKYAESYEQEAGNYEMYEHLAMAYQSDVASQASTSQDGTESVGAAVFPQRIETVVRVRARGEIKCDWRADHPPAAALDPPAHPAHPAHPAPPAPPAPPPPRPSRWGLKPSDVNIVLTGGEQYIQPSSPQPVYKIQSLANRTDAPTDYDEAYMDMYGASDRLQYGDCFSTDTMNIDNMNMTNMANMANIATIASMVSMAPAQSNIMDIDQVPMPSTSPAAKVTEPKETRSTLDARIDKALRETVLGEVAKDIEPVEEQKDVPEKGILLTGNMSAVEPGRGVKRVSFADGYKPGQDSDVEEPPVKKRRSGRSGRRVGCAWPCPATHADHVPLWDALPPPPPPPGDPPRSCRRALASARDSGIPLGGFMPPEPPPGLISF